MRSFSHWTPAYIYHRILDWIYRSRNPQSPWLTPRAVEYLEEALQPGFIGLEYGSGRSTTWFARRVNKLISVEHNVDWYNRVKCEIEKQKLSNVQYHHFLKPDNSLNMEKVMKSEYVQVSADIQEDSLNFVLVDGVARPACVIRSIPLLKNGGLLIIDDANHYLPCTSWAPNTRTVKDGPLNEEWIQVQKELEGWKNVWFGNGIKETVVFRKPELP
jgi:hypothetical protein